MVLQLNITGFVAISVFAHTLFLYQLNFHKTDIDLSSLEGVDTDLSRKIINISIRYSSRNEVPVVKNSKSIAQNKLRSINALEKQKIVKEYINDNFPVKSNKGDSNVPIKKTDNAVLLATQREQRVSVKKEQRVYLKKILQKIELNKFYPSFARRRNIQELIPVSFMLTKFGKVTDISIGGRNKTLNYAARKAILNSLPFDTPPKNMSLPYLVKYSMVFTIKN